MVIQTMEGDVNNLLFDFHGPIGRGKEGSEHSMMFIDTDI
jgi:hypothetical protein